LSIPHGMVQQSRVPSRKPASPEARLSAADWETAALDALADGGLAGIAIQPLARRLGVTKGSFYWHFADREALLAAALAHWETSHTERVIEAVESVRDPRERLARLIGRVLTASTSRSRPPGIRSRARPWRASPSAGSPTSSRATPSSASRGARPSAARWSPTPPTSG
jgi:AcrR family transcriptional regulator